MNKLDTKRQKTLLHLGLESFALVKMLYFSHWPLSNQCLDMNGYDKVTTGVPKKTIVNNFYLYLLD